MTTYSFLASELAPRLAEDCRFHIIPAPYEESVSYGGGTAEGPEAILYASQQLEVWTGRNVPSECGIYTWPPVDCDGTPEEVLKRIEDATAHALKHGPQATTRTIERTTGIPACNSAPVVPVLLGGEHTVTLGALRALKKQYGTFGVVQFDAHGDLRDTYEGSPYSHACVMRRAVADLELPLFQVGVRSMCLDEVIFRASMNIHHLDARELHSSSDWKNLPMNSENSASLLPGDFPKRVFLTFDIDALDASLMPATGTPEPGGLLWWDALHLVERCLAERTVVGFDVVELAPISSIHAATYTAARLVHEIMGIVRG